MDKTTYYISKIHRLKVENIQLTDDVKKLENELAALEDISIKHRQQIACMTRTSEKLNNILQNILKETSAATASHEERKEKVRMEKWIDEHLEQLKKEENN